MILSDFLKGRDVRINAVSNYISRNPELFNGHVTRQGKNTILDDEAIRILDEKYPFPKPNIIINGLDPEAERELREKLQKAQELIIKLQNDLTDQKILNAEYEANKRLLEAHEKALEDKITELSADLEKEKSRKWWQKLTKKA